MQMKQVSFDTNIFLSAGKCFATSDFQLLSSFVSRRISFCVLAVFAFTYT
jgi:hypothetical protein